jgi:dihydroneopterin aldolase
MDRIVLPRIPLAARVGVSEEERGSPQDVEVGLVLHLDLARAGASDALVDTVDYEAVCRRVTDIVGSRPYRLIESLAEAVARAVLAGFEVAEVEVRVEKPGALLTYGVPYAAVEIRRRRDA